MNKGKHSMSIQYKSKVIPNSNSLIFIFIVILILTQEVAYSQSNSENISRQQKYDDNGRPIELIDPSGRICKLKYTEGMAGETIITKRYNKNDAIVYKYNNQGLISSMKDAYGNVKYQYNELGLLSQVQRNGEPEIKYEYDTGNRITSQTVGDFYKIGYAYDFKGRLSTMSTPYGNISYKYQMGQGQIIRELPNEVKTIWEFGVNGQLLETTHIDPNNYILLKLIYQYRADGLIDAISEKSQQGENVTFYKYDNVDRLIGVTDQLGREYKYEYDLLGNRLSASSSIGSEQTSKYDWAGRLISFNNKNCTYDMAGNLNEIYFGDSKMNYKYNQDQQLINVNDKVFYKYSGDGNLIEREVNNKKTKFVSNPLTDFWQPLVMENSSGKKTMYFWEGNSPLIKIANDKVEYLLTDHLGSARLIVNKQGMVKRYVNYDPFGNIKERTHENCLSTGFTGLFYDSNTNLYITKARAYNSILGQFLQIEPEKHIPTGSQKNLSLYAYCGHDPVNYSDKNGDWPEFTWGPENWAWQAIFNTDWLDRDYAKEYYANRETNTQSKAMSWAWGTVGGYIPGDAKTIRQKYISDVWDFVPAISTGRTFVSSLLNAKEGKIKESFSDIVSLVIGYIGGTKNIDRLGKNIIKNKLDKYIINQSLKNTNNTLVSGKKIIGNLSNIKLISDAGNKLLDYKNDLDNLNSNVGGVALSGAGATLDGFGEIKGLLLDANNNLILINKKGNKNNLPSFRIDDVVTVFRSVYVHGEGPNVTIDPNPNDPENSAMIIKHGKTTEDTYVGWVLYQADRIMKNYMLGVDNITQKNIVSNVQGYKSVLNSIYFGSGVSNSSNYKGKWERFWIVPAEIDQYEANDLTLFDVPLKVKTQVMKWMGNKLVNNITGKSSLGAKNFSKWFTNNYDAIAKEQYLMPPSGFGIKDSVQVFTELRQIAVITALAEKMRDQGVVMPFWMRDYRVKKVQLKKYTPALVVTRTNGNVKARIFGGVSLSVNSKDVKQIRTTADIVKLPEEKRDQGVQNIQLVNSLSEAIIDHNTLTSPLQCKTIEIKDNSFETIQLPGSETKILSPCIISEVDLSVPIVGGKEINLSRYFNSFFNPKGIWGHTWTMDLPRLEKIRVPINRSSSSVNYQTAYELITPLNSIYAGFSQIKKVPALNSQLQVPDDECEFYGLANSNPDFLTNSTIELIGKTGESWHFTKTGELIAIEKDGFRIVYLRNEFGNVEQIVGLLGKNKMASIDIKYDNLNRIKSAIGKNKFGKEQFVNYEYDDSGKLINVNKTQENFTYKYDNELVSDVIRKVKSENKQDIKFQCSYKYNDNRQLISKTDENNRKVDYKIDSRNGVTKLQIDWENRNDGISAISYDETFRPIEIMYNNDTKATFAYLDAGEILIDIIDSDGESVHITESSDKTKRTIESKNQPIVTEIYDQMERLTQFMIGNESIFSQQWSPLGKLIAIETENTVVQPQYDTDGLTESITLYAPGAGNQIREWEQINLDFAGRPIQIKDFSGLNIIIQYDENGKVLNQITKRNGENYGYEFIRNENSRIKTIRSSWGVDQFTYDSDGDLAQLLTNKIGYDNQASIQFNSGRLQKVVQFDGSQTEIFYNENGSIDLISEIKCPNGLKISYQYDPKNDIKIVNIGDTRQIQVNYDNRGRIIGYSFCKY